jgi:hypothetical protein
VVLWVYMYFVHLRIFPIEDGRACCGEEDGAEGQPYLKNHRPPYPATGHNTANTTSQPVMPTISGRGRLSLHDSVSNSFSPSPQEKFGHCGKKIPPPPPVERFSLLKEFGLKKNTNFVCLNGKIMMYFLEFPRIREDKRKETIFLKVSPFSALF